MFWVCAGFFCPAIVQLDFITDTTRERETLQCENSHDKTLILVLLFLGEWESCALKSIGIATQSWNVSTLLCPESAHHGLTHREMPEIPISDFSGLEGTSQAAPPEKSNPAPLEPPAPCVLGALRKFMLWCFGEKWALQKLGIGNRCWSVKFVCFFREHMQVSLVLLNCHARAGLISCPQSTAGINLWLNAFLIIRETFPVASLLLCFLAVIQKPGCFGKWIVLASKEIWQVKSLF